MRLTYIGYDPCSPVLSYLARRPDIRINRVATSGEPWGEHVRLVAARHGLTTITERVSAAALADFAADSDVVLCACYDYRLRLPAGSACVFLNIHPSLLPLGRGPTPVQWTLLYQPESAGVTLHVLTDALDGGPIVGQVPLTAYVGEGYESYMHRTNQGAIGLLAALDDVSLRCLAVRPQDSARGSYNPVMPEALRTITPALTVRQTLRMVSAAGPLGALVTIDGVTYAVSQAEGIETGAAAPEPPFVNWLYGQHPCSDGYCIFPRSGLRPLS